MKALSPKEVQALVSVGQEWGARTDVLVHLYAISQSREESEGRLKKLNQWGKALVSLGLALQAVGDGD